MRCSIVCGEGEGSGAKGARTGLPAGVAAAVVVVQWSPRRGEAVPPSAMRRVDGCVATKAMGPVMGD